MKKAVALLLGLVLVLAFALVACGDDATDTSDDTATTVEATDTTEATEGSDDAATGAVDWTEAVDYEGEEVTITGTVAAVNNLYEEKGIGKALVRLGGDSKSDHFNITFVLDPDTGAWPDYLAEYEPLFSTLVGKTVEVTGTVSLNSFEAAYEIMINDTDNNTIPDDAANGTMVVK